MECDMSLRDILELEDYTPDTRWCRSCEQEVSLDLWNTGQVYGSHQRYHCKPCVKKQANYLKILKANHKFDNPTHCAICDIEPSKVHIGNNGGNDRAGKMKTILIIDHCHKTGQFRGWVCDACNNVLSRAKDNPTILRSAAKYLEDFENGEGE